MQLEFSLKHALEDVFINTVTLRLKSGQVIVLDRRRTVYSKEELNIIFQDLYEWNGERELPLPSPKEFVGAKLTYIEYEEDDWIPEDYTVEISECHLYTDDTGPIKIKIDIEPEDYHKRIRMYLLDDDRDDYEMYFTDRLDNDTPILARYEFDTPKKFLRTWKDVSEDPVSMWYWVYDGAALVCSGAIDPNDEEIYAEYFEEEL